MRRSPLPPRTTRLRRRGRPRYASYVADRGYQAWVRAHPCVIGTGCEGRIEAAHVTSRGAGGQDENNLTPMCHRHHAMQHTMGLVSFGERFEVNLRAIAETLWRDYTERGSE